MKLSSFKQPVSDAPLPPRTPSPIVRFVEPLTPTCPTAYKDGPLFPNSSASGLVEALQNYGWSVSNAHAGKRASSERVPSVSVKAERAPPSSRQTNGHGSRSSSHGSPIDALADIASSMAPTTATAKATTMDTTMATDAMSAPLNARAQRSRLLSNTTKLQPGQSRVTLTLLLLLLSGLTTSNNLQEMDMQHTQIESPIPRSRRTTMK
ncbi:hypothetical protein SLS58_008027 [Diplodia intermedia]|uniref:Uncharacterized protein n=1 Tax=Diplodia intermedia TaxID=856260 RepID=A0ABR3TIH2_9PEZI